MRPGNSGSVWQRNSPSKSGDVETQGVGFMAVRESMASITSGCLVEPLCLARRDFTISSWSNKRCGSACCSRDIKVDAVAAEFIALMFYVEWRCGVVGDKQQNSGRLNNGDSYSRDTHSSTIHL